MNVNIGQQRICDGLIAQTDDPEILEWLSNADARGGGFISSIARAALVADWEHYPLIRPFILILIAKHPKYEASAEVRAEIARRT